MTDELKFREEGTPAGEGDEEGTEPSDKGVAQMYKRWFLDYASYVILDRAIPEVEDGLKPVQRRILHSLWEMDDGRFNKAANVIGHTMRYHPHGDMAICDALVKLAQKGLLIDMQGNWGNPLTGDQAAAARYIEARLTPFARSVVFSEHITPWQNSYDGRSKEPIALPVKFPLLLFQGAEGIAVGLATKILPHNFCELVKESIAVLRGYKPKLLPDFPSGGLADFSEYSDGARGGKIKVRAKIEVLNSKQIVIREIPYGTTTTSLIDSILSANDKGKIKIKKIEDNTAKDVEILIHLAAGMSPEQVIAGLFAFTDCETSISPNCCVIAEGRPLFCSVSELLTRATNRTRQILKLELEHERHVLREKLHLATLEQIFVEERIYRKIETSESWEHVLRTTEKALKAFHEQLVRELTQDDVLKILELKIKRIAKFDQEKNKALIAELKAKLEEVEKNLASLTAFCIAYFKDLLKTYGKSFPRKTEIATFAQVKAAKVAVADQKVYIDRKEGFVGTNIKDGELLGECSEFTEILTLSQAGELKVHRANEKTYVGKNVLYADFFKPSERCIFHLVYRDGREGPVFGKRFDLMSYTRNRLYDLTRGTKGSRVLYFSKNPNGEQEKVQVLLKDNGLLKGPGKLHLDFATLAIKPRTLIGTVITHEKVDKVVQVLQGASTLAAQRVWFDREKNKLNKEGEGIYLGKYSGEESLLAVYKSGSFEIFPFDWDHHFSPDLLEIQFFDPSQILSVVYFDEEKDDHFVKRVAVGEFERGRYDFVPLRSSAKVLVATLREDPRVTVHYKGNRNTAQSEETFRISELIEVKGIHAAGNRLARKPVRSVSL
ncbi:MAG: DNA gyrase/topoisomerase IV subunit A [Deltaproteobacteria bacterium]|nr:DNA gyrase/topoisomerase IV subunit A [Deltaproteobacteria bacterium]